MADVLDSVYSIYNGPTETSTKIGSLINMAQHASNCARAGLMDTAVESKIHHKVKDLIMQLDHTY